jgi:predicted NBD/HSP70 family sugar kinase
VPSVKVRLSGTNLVRAADHNQRITLHAIRVHKGITRVALAKLTGLTAPAVANIVKRLIDDDLICEKGRLRQGRGQPGKLLQINPLARFSFGVNIDRDHVAIALVNFVGEVLAERQFDMSFALPAQVAQLWQDHASAMIAQAGVEVSRLVGVGVAMPDDLGAILIPGAPASYADWTNTDCTEIFATPFDVPVFLENDASAAALGEQQFGCGPELASALYILMSSGLGGGLLIDGHYMRGATGRSGEIGLIPTGRGSELVQDHVSLSGLAWVLGEAGLTIADLARWDEDAAVLLAFETWLTGAVERLVPPLAAVNCLFNPAGIVIGARMPSALTDRLASALEQALRGLRPPLPACAPIRRAVLSANAPAIGAAILPFSHTLLPRADALWKDDAF